MAVAKALTKNRAYQQLVESALAAVARAMALMEQRMPGLCNAPALFQSCTCYVIGQSYAPQCWLFAVCNLDVS